MENPKAFKIGDRITYKSKDECGGLYLLGGSDQDGYIGELLEYIEYYTHQKCWKIEVSTRQDSSYFMLEYDFKEYEERLASKLAGETTEEKVTTLHGKEIGKWYSFNLKQITHIVLVTHFKNDKVYFKGIYHQEWNEKNYITHPKDWRPSTPEEIERAKKLNPDNKVEVPREKVSVPRKEWEAGDVFKTIIVNDYDSNFLSLGEEYVSVDISIDNEWVDLKTDKSPYGHRTMYFDQVEFVRKGSPVKTDTELKLSTTDGSMQTKIGAPAKTIQEAYENSDNPLLFVGTETFQLDKSLGLFNLVNPQKQETKSNEKIEIKIRPKNKRKLNLSTLEDIKEIKFKIKNKTK